MEVARTDAGNVIPPLHADMRNFGMHFQSLYPEDDVNARILHLLGPSDIGSFVETCQQLYDHRHLLAVACRTNQCLHHLGIPGKTVKRGLDALHFLAHSRLLQNANVIVEAVIRYMNETVALLYQFQQASTTVQFGLDDGFPCGIFQVLAATIGKRHQVLMVMVTATTQHSIQLVQIQFVHHALQ